MQTQALVKAYAEAHKAVLSIAKTLGTNLMLQVQCRKSFKRGIDWD